MQLHPTITRLFMLLTCSRPRCASLSAAATAAADGAFCCGCAGFCVRDVVAAWPPAALLRVRGSGPRAFVLLRAPRGWAEGPSVACLRHIQLTHVLHPRLQLMGRQPCPCAQPRGAPSGVAFHARIASQLPA